MHQDDDETCAEDDVETSCATDDHGLVPPTLRENEPVLGFVRVGMVFGNRLAILERDTLEPLQFVPSGHSPEVTMAHAYRLAKSWDEYFQQIIAKMVNAS